jgi:phosphatidylserine/phosphatidylglycerophosphate/cardiolipin synthase-like enzyme
MQRRLKKSLKWRNKNAFTGAAVLALLVATGMMRESGWLTGLAAPQVLPAHGSVQVAFTPEDDAEQLIVTALNAARRQILMQAYLLSNRKIAAALMDAHARGIKVRILVDGAQISQTRGSRVLALACKGIDIGLETKYRNAHNKIIIIDVGNEHPVLITGSFNFTEAAQRKNAENVLIIRDFVALTRQYEENWHRHAKEALPYYEQAQLKRVCASLR